MKGNEILEFPEESEAGPAPRGSIPGPCPPNHCLCSAKREMCPPSEDCAPKKVTSSVPMECSSRPQNPKILVITSEFVSKNCFFRIFRNEDIFFLVFILEFVEIPTYFAVKIFGFWFTLSNSKLEVFVPPKKIVYAPPVTILWRRAWSKDEERWSVEEQIE